MFQDRYFVPKSTDTYADALTAWGLAAVLSDVLAQAEQPRANRVTVAEEASAFIVELPVALRPEWVESAQKTHLTYFIARDAAQAAEWKGERVVNMDEEWKRIARRKEWREAGNDPKSDDPALREQWMALQPHEHFNLFAAAQKLSGDAPSNKIWSEIEKVIYPQLLSALLSQFCTLPSANTFGSTHSTATLLNPGQGMGTNDLAPRGASGDKIKEAWPGEWLKAVGFYQAAFCASFQNSKGKTSGISVVVLCPRRISLRNHYEVRKAFSGTFYAASSLKIECLAALRYADAFLTFAQYDADADEVRGRSVADAISGFSMAYFMDVRQGVNFIVKRITFLAMPLWISVPANGDVEPIKNAVQEYIKVLRPLDDARGETRALMDAYLAWSSSGDLRFFWKFCAGYGAYRMECATDSKLPFQPTALTTHNLEVILMNQIIGEKPLAPVIGDEGFQNVARAIRKSTITALYRKNELPSGMEVHYGLAQELRRLAPYKDKFTARLMQHLQSYNEENVKASVRQINANSPFRRANITTRDIERIVELIDEYGAETMCGLLLAYGYARDFRDPTDADTNADPNNVNASQPAQL